MNKDNNNHNYYNNTSRDGFMNKTYDIPSSSTPASNNYGYSRNCNDYSPSKCNNTNTNTNSNTTNFQRKTDNNKG